jgi:hypothetical protein
MNETDGTSATQTVPGSVAYDSAERRGAFAASMQEAGLDPELIRGRLAADRNQATHPREAAKANPRKNQTAGASRTQGLERERGGLSP